MIDASVPEGQAAPVPTRLALLLTFAQIGACGFGGVGPWARRIIVEERRWLDEREYAEVLGLCQVIPGPNVGNVAVLIGDRFHGLAGSALALLGLMSGPLTILATLAYLYDQLGGMPLVDGAIGGVAAAAAGLFLGTALRIAERLRLSPGALVVAAAAFVGVGLLKLPLLAVIGGLAPVGIALAWQRAAP